MNEIEYENALQMKRYYERREDEYLIDKRRVSSDLTASKKEKLNLEKRLKGVQKVINMLDGSKSLFSEYVPERISRANKSVETASFNYSGCIKCSGINTSSLSQKFNSESVHGNIYSSQALSGLRREETRLNYAISEIENQINRLGNKLDELNSQIRTCRNIQNELKSDIRIYLNS